jgi:hypothetical protein
MVSFRRQIAIYALLALMLVAPAMAQNPLLLTQGTATGSLTATNSGCTATACVQIPVNALNGAVGVQITGTFVGTVSFEGSVDGVTWVGMAVVPLGTAGVRVLSATGTGVWQANVAGLTSMRARCSAYTSGTAVVTMRRSAGFVSFGVAP